MSHENSIASLVETGAHIGMIQIPAEITAFSAFVAAIHPHNVMEIGSWAGGVFYILVHVSSGKKISVDFDGYGEIDMEARNKMFRSWSPDVYPILGDSHSDDTLSKVKDVLAGEMLDFLFIDGDHSYDGVKMDYAMYSPLVRKGGWIAFHDINYTQTHRSAGCMVDKFWNELTVHKMVITMSAEYGGFGILQKTW